ncbi:MAG: GTP-binding protein, partial [Lachnospiraceae bacterium]|nr:GTP-binding protein [Lachnospiraceae bacterium]
PSGVGKLSDVVKAVEDVAADLEVQINSAVAVVDATKCKMYIKNFGEFFVNQIEHAGTIILSRTDKVSQEKLNTCVEMIREYNKEATIITTPWDQLEGKAILETIEGEDKLEEMMQELLEHAKEHHHEHGEHCTCGCHGHHHDHEEHEHHCHHDHEHEEHEHCCHYDHDHEEHEHHHHHDHEEHDENCTCGCHDHEHHHDHHGHHHADEVFTSWGVETANVYSQAEIEQILTALDSGEYGMILRSKGMVPAEDGTWIYFDYVPEEHDIRAGKPEVTGKLCVIGSKLEEEKIAALFRA